MNERTEPTEPTLFLAIGPGPIGGDDLVFRVSPDDADLLLALLQAEGIRSEAPHVASSAQELATVAASISGGLVGIAAVLRAYFHRNQHRLIKFTRRDETYEMKGLSQKETDEIIDKMLQATLDDNRSNDDEWRKYLKGLDEDD